MDSQRGGREVVGIENELKGCLEEFFFYNMFFVCASVTRIWNPRNGNEQPFHKSSRRLGLQTMYLGD